MKIVVAMKLVIKYMSRDGRCESSNIFKGQLK